MADSENDPLGLYKDEHAEIQVLLYADTRYSSPLNRPIRAGLYGESSGHSAANIRFTNHQIFNDFIKNANPPIPENLYYITEENGRTYYNVILSYGPKYDAKSKSYSKDGELQDYLTSCLYSQLSVPAEVNPKFKSYVDENTIQSALLPLMPTKKSPINPTSIVHLSLIPHEWGDPKKAQFQLKTFALNLEDSERKYTAISGENGANRPESDAALEVHIKFVKAQIMLLKQNITNDMPKNSIERKKMEQMSEQEFFGQLNKCMTIGLGPRDSVTLGLDNDAAHGLNLILALKELQKLNQNPGKYDFIDNNCAHMVRRLLSKSTSNTEIQSRLEMPKEDEALGGVLAILRGKNPLTRAPLVPPVDLENAAINIGEPLRIGKGALYLKGGQSKIPYPEQVHHHNEKKSPEDDQRSNKKTRSP